MKSSTQINPSTNWLKQINQRLTRLTTIDVKNANIARFICKVIPTTCPFERDINLLGRKLIHIPPLCKLNPFYTQLIELRFKCLCYLADQCGEDISAYC